MFRMAIVLLLTAAVPASAQSTNTTGQTKADKGATTATTNGGQVETISGGDLGSGRVKDKTSGRKEFSGTDLGSGRVKKEPKSN